MLPDIRAVIATVVVAVGLLAMAFGLAATFRVAQDSRAASLHADLAQRGRAPLPPSIAPHAGLIVDTPAPAVKPPSTPEVFVAGDAPAAAETQAETRTETAVEITEAEPGPQVAAAPMSLASEPPAIWLPTTAAMPAAEPPVGGPFTEPASVQAQSPEQVAATKKAAKAAADKRARAARIVRNRRAAAARRAALARLAKAKTTAPSGWDAGQTNSPDALNAGFGNVAPATKAR